MKSFVFRKTDKKLCHNRVRLHQLLCCAGPEYTSGDLKDSCDSIDSGNELTILRIAEK